VTLACLEPLERAADVADPAPAPRDQVLGQRALASVVVDADRRERGRGLALEEDDRRTGDRQAFLDQAGARPELRPVEDDPLDPMRREHVDDGLDVGRLEAAELLEQEGVARLLAGLGDPVEGLRDAEEAESGRNHAERVGAPLDEAARHRAGLEADGRDGGLHGAPRLGRDVGAAVDDARDRLRGDPAHAGDLLDGRSVLPRHSNTSARTWRRLEPGHRGCYGTSCRER
jgi:hypothetical protein